MSERLPAVVDLQAYRGDTWAQTFRFLVGGSPLDLSSASVAAEATRHDVTSELAVAVSDAAAGEVTLGMPTPPLDAGRYSYDVEVTEGDGTITTWVRGKLLVDQDVTNGD